MVYDEKLRLQNEENSIKLGNYILLLLSLMAGCFLISGLLPKYAECNYGSAQALGIDALNSNISAV